MLSLFRVVRDHVADVDVLARSHDNSAAVAEIVAASLIEPADFHRRRTAYYDGGHPGGPVRWTRLAMGATGWPVILTKNRHAGTEQQAKDESARFAAALNIRRLPRDLALRAEQIRQAAEALGKSEPGVHHPRTTEDGH